MSWRPNPTASYLALSVLIVCFLVSSLGAIGRDRPQAKAAEPTKFAIWQGDIKTFEEHWNTLVGQRAKIDAAKWQSLEDDLRSLTKKHAERIEDHVRWASGTKLDVADGGFS